MAAPEVCDLGIHLFEPPKPLLRIPAQIDGKDCLVGYVLG
jgi:hypothetical protein